MTRYPPRKEIVHLPTRDGAAHHPPDGTEPRIITKGTKGTKGTEVLLSSEAVGVIPYVKTSRTCRVGQKFCSATGNLVFNIPANTMVLAIFMDVIGTKQDRDGPK
jgi:hypothetical protein